MFCPKIPEFLDIHTCMIASMLRNYSSHYTNILRIRCGWRLMLLLSEAGVSVKSN
jgi:hypothetical protein